MLQDANKGKMPKAGQPDIKSTAVQAGEKAKEAKNKIQQGVQIASQVSSYAVVAQQMGSSFSNHGGTTGHTSGVTHDADLPPGVLGR